jgi:hypothetical protein
VGDRVVRGERGGVDEKAAVEVVGRERSGGSQVLARDVGCEARCGGARWVRGEGRRFWDERVSREGDSGNGTDPVHIMTKVIQDDQNDGIRT